MNLVGNVGRVSRKKLVKAFNDSSWKLIHPNSCFLKLFDWTKENNELPGVYYSTISIN